MIKKIATLAIAAIVMAGSSAFAQTQQTEKTEKQCATQCAKGKHCLHERMQCNEFAGITLTDAQKAEIEAVKAEFRKDRQKMAQDTDKAAAKGEKVAKEARKDGEKMLDKANTKRAEYLAKIKNILTPEQYVIYLENKVTNQSGNHSRMHAKAKMHKKGEMQKKGERQDKGRREQGDKK
ncbi:MAG: Spy/CpxP family protein refolding chaperone [Muribaculaceae bacterium]|nr:Spy/CpxP family protein refolding chaperone [Muribaculaceae bacterium]